MHNSEVGRTSPVLSHDYSRVASSSMMMSTRDRNINNDTVYDKVIDDSLSKLGVVSERRRQNPVPREIAMERDKEMSRAAKTPHYSQESSHLPETRFLATDSILSYSNAPPFSQSAVHTPAWIADATGIQRVSIAGNTKARKPLPEVPTGEDTMSDGIAETVRQRASDSTCNTEIMHERDKEQSSPWIQRFQDPVVAADGFTYERAKIEVHSNPIFNSA